MSEIKVWQIDDCDFVAAETLPAAIEWYESFTGVKADPDDAVPYSLDTKMHTGEGPHDPDSVETTFGEQIKVEREFPCLLASTEI
jgi:hypothetical protein